MNKSLSWAVLFISVLMFLGFISSEPAVAQVLGGGELGSRVGNLTKNLVNMIVPLIAILGLIYAGILGATGDPSAKQRMVVVIIFSVICFMAKFIVQWLQSASGGGI